MENQHKATIRILDLEFQERLSYADIQGRIKALAVKMNSDLNGKNPLFLAVLNGSFMFASDLFRLLDVNARIQFVKLSSYEGTVSTHELTEHIGLEQSIENEHIVILEDIVDTGRTLNHLIPALKAKNPAQIDVCTLLLKPEMIQYPIDITHKGFEVGNEFLVGYGLDYNGFGRHYESIYQLIPSLDAK